ncbi:hypothetical protein HLH17_02185 [Acinetobacter sp. ANC 5380]|uniref:Uncharacterized protein n=1 Tax=Acinetobacter terrae TaxID=2731247 RepID=A0A7Y2RCY8_9GAMM|nr:hypothetical protein [Acinetobacter terrae]NNH76510.1 hypothetical protein [Acinetobacter terrae]
MARPKSLKVVCNFKDINSVEDTLIEIHLRLAISNKLVELDLPLRAAAERVGMSLGKFVYQLNDSVAGGPYNYLIMANKLDIRGYFSLVVYNEAKQRRTIKYKLSEIHDTLHEYEALICEEINARMVSNNISLRKLSTLVGMSTTNITYHLNNTNGRSLQSLMLIACKLNIRGEILLSLELPPETN